MIAPRPLAPLAAAAVAVLLAGCQSTQGKSAELAATGGVATKEKGLEIDERSRAVKVTAKSVVSDRNGTAVVVEVRNRSKRPLVGVPLAIDVRKGGESVFANDAPGLEASLTSIAALAPGERMAWVNDQVFEAGPKVRAVVGTTAAKAPAKLPEIAVGPPRVGGDPTSGFAIEGKLTNRSKLLQRKLVIFAVARKDGRVVAAGRGQVERLRPGASAPYQVFFIGNPAGARVELAAPPTTFE